MKALLNYTGSIIFIAMLCTACVYSDTLYEGIINAKSAWFFFITGAAFVFLATRGLIRPVKFKPNALDLAIALFFAYVLINNSFHDRQILSKKNMEDAGLLIAYFFVKALFVSPKPLYRPFMVFILLFTFLQIVIAVLQWFEYWPSYNFNYKFTGFFFNPSPYIIFLSVLLVYCLAIGLNNSSKVIRITALSVFIAGLPVVAITLSRAAWLGLLAGVLLILLLRFGLFKKATVYIKSAGIKFIIITGLLVLSVFAARHLYALKQDSADGRLLIWKIALTMIPDHPFTGLGQGGFHASVLKYQSLYFQTHPNKIPTEGRLADRVAYAFNDLLQITTEQGIAGLLLFVAIIAMAIKTGRLLIKSTDNEWYIARPLAAITVILIAGLFSYPLTVLPIQILFYISLGIISGRYAAKAMEETGIESRLTTTRWGLSFICFAAGIFYINYSIHTWKGYKLAYIARDNGFKANNIDTLKPYHDLLQHENWYVLMQADELLTHGKVDQAIATLERAKKFSSDKGIYYALAKLYAYQKQYALAESQYKFVYYALPQLLSPQYLLAKFYYNTGQTIKFKQLARQIISFKPKIASPEATGMQLEIASLLKQHE